MLFLFFLACDNAPKPQTEVKCSLGGIALGSGEQLIRVNSFKELCEHPNPNRGVVDCFLVQEGNYICGKDWSSFPHEIEEFQYKEGFVYLLKIKVVAEEEPLPPDVYPLRYILVEVLSKVAK